MSDMAILRTIGRLPEMPIYSVKKSEPLVEAVAPEQEDEPTAEAEPTSIKQQYANKRQRTDLPELRQPQQPTESPEPKEQGDTEDVIDLNPAGKANKWADLYSAEAPMH